ncbi:MAG TPA: alpha/beta fold hydrolase, partial [Polyangia bacterium]
HRDVKPGNILVDRNGNAFLGDFGMATLPEDHPAQAVRGGTPGFMAPEQARGEPVGPAADQFSFARTIIEILVGGSDGADVDDALAMLPPAAAPLVNLLRVATRTEPAARWRTMNDLVAQLQAVELPDVAPAVRLAPERRVLQPFAWTANAHRVDEPAPAIGRADFRLSDLESRALLRGDACAKFRAETGYADFGWALYARTDRLGPIGPSTLARASELVVLLHGWGCTRTVWHDLALAICRDNADAVVLVPDTSGFGESRMLDVAAKQLEPKSLGSAILYWLSLVGVRDFPGALVGHSMSGLNLAMLAPAQVGARLARVAVTPAFMEVVPWQRFMMRMGTLLLALGARSRLARWIVARLLSLQSFSAPTLTREDRLMMVRNIVASPMRTLAMLARSILTARLPPKALRGVELVFGAQDPMQPPRAQEKLVALFAGDRDRVHVMASGGHFPHMAFADHPEWSARNQDELVRIIGAVLLSSTEGAVASTLAV